MTSHRCHVVHRHNSHFCAQHTFIFVTRCTTFVLLNCTVFCLEYCALSVTCITSSGSEAHSPAKSKSIHCVSSRLISLRSFALVSHIECERECPFDAHHFRRLASPVTCLWQLAWHSNDLWSSKRSANNRSARLDSAAHYLPVCHTRTKALAIARAQSGNRA